MTLRTCPQEKELADLLNSAKWPDSASAEIQAHVAGCPACSARVSLTQSFRRERAQVSAAARLEAPGVLWWRAQLRRRNTALTRIGRPLLGAQVFAVLVALAAALGFLIAQARQKPDAFAWLADLPRSLRLEVLLPASMQNSAIGAWMVLGLVAGLLLLSGVAVYASTEKC